MSALHRRPLAMLGAIVLLVAMLGAMITAPTAQAAARDTKPTIVLVHGAWADSSGWNAELEALHGIAATSSHSTGKGKANGNGNGNGNRHRVTRSPKIVANFPGRRA